MALFTNAIYLKDSSVVIDDIKFYGSAWRPRFFNWVFNLRRGAELREKWELPQLKLKKLIKLVVQNSD